MTAKQVQQVFPELEQPELQEIQTAIDAITEDYKFRPIELKQVASGYRFQVKQDLSRWYHGCLKKNRQNIHVRYWKHWQLLPTGNR